MVRQQGQGFHKVRALCCDTSNPPPRFMLPRPSVGSHLSAGCKSEAWACCWITAVFTAYTELEKKAPPAYLTLSLLI